MAQLKINVVQHGITLTKTVNLATDTVDDIITRLINDNDIPAPPSAGGGVTIWKMTKSGSRGDYLGRCTPTAGFSDGDTAYLLLVPR